MSALATSGGRFSNPPPGHSSTSDIAKDDWLLFPEFVGIGSRSFPPGSAGCCSPGAIGESAFDNTETVGDIDSLSAELLSDSEPVPPSTENKVGSEKSGNLSPSSMVVATDKRCGALGTKAGSASIVSSSTMQGTGVS